MGGVKKKTGLGRTTSKDKRVAGWAGKTSKKTPVQEAKHAWQKKRERPVQRGGKKVQ